MTGDLQRLQAVFGAAAEMQDLAERSAYLERECGGDAGFRKNVEKLLAAHDDSAELPPAAAENGTGAYTPGPDATDDQSPAAEQPGAFIGNYKLLQKLGEGGMGAVWAAEQAQPVKRRVALKLIKAGMDSSQVLRRFDAERQALALMEHPNIAKVLDAGTTPQGRPYFAMELIKGIPITKFCDQEHLTPRERLELFIPVCQAVQHAHQKGVIHRDLKPSNVLIALYDGKPVPKIIDFGVAKATHQKLTERTMYTEVGQIVGTLEYMAPEQAELNNLDIDTRADIYSLGVILYELLAGSPPFTAKQLRGAAFVEMLRLIREVEPPKPSTRLSSSAELPAIAANRKLEPNRLRRFLQGDLDWIVMKALEKDRARRYETANGFAMDLQRYLADEPVLAGPPGAGYRIQKFVQRHRATVAMASLMLVALVIGAGVATWQAVRATRAEVVAEQERDRAEAGFQHARQAVDEYFTTVSESKLFDVPGLQPLRKELLESALKYYQSFLKERVNDQSVTAEVAAASYRVAYLTQDIGTAEAARTAYQKALDLYETLVREYPHEPKFRADLAICCNDFGNFARRSGDLDQTLRLHRQAQVLREQLVREHPNNVRMQNELAKSYSNIGATFNAKNQYAEGLASLEQASAINARILSSPAADFSFPSDLGKRLNTGWNVRMDYALNYESVAYAHFRLGHTAQTIEFYQKARELMESIHREQPTNTNVAERLARCCSLLGWQLGRAGQLDAARAAYERSRTVAEQLIAANPTMASFRSTLSSVLVNLGTLERNSKKYDEALGHYAKARDHFETIIREQPAYPGHRRELARVLFNIAIAQGALRKLEDAEQTYRRTMEIYRQLSREFPKVPFDRQQLGPIRRELAYLLLEMDRAQEAQDLFRQGIEDATQLAKEFDDTAGIHNDFAWALAVCPVAALRDTGRALVEARRAVELTPENGTFMSTLGTVYYFSNEHKAAITTLNKALPLLSGGNSFEFFILAMAHWKLGKKVEARRWHAEAVQWMDQNLPHDYDLKSFRALAGEMLGVAKDQK